MRRIIVVLSFSQAACFGPRTAAPPPVPEKKVPALPDDLKAPTRPGTGRLVLDVVGDNARVEEIVETTSEAWASAGPHVWRAEGRGEARRPVCRTPCAVDLSIGLHRLRFASSEGGRSGEVEVQVDSQPRVVRYELGYDKSRSWAWPGLIYGLGGSVIAGGLLVTVAQKTEADRGMGYATIGIGAGIVAIAVLIDYLTRGEVREGSFVHFVP
jgi:hypothetical protein